MITINRKRAIELLAEAVNERGANYVYDPKGGRNSTEPRCSYVRDGEASCGVGVALAKAGVPIEVLSTFDVDVSDNASLGGTIETVVYNGLTRNEGIVITDAALKLFSSFQARQDSQDTWGDSLAHAITRTRKKN